MKLNTMYFIIPQVISRQPDKNLYTLSIERGTETRQKINGHFKHAVSKFNIKKECVIYITFFEAGTFVYTLIFSYCKVY